MTRINCIHPKHLCNKHLVAEYRELPRVVKLAVNAYARGGDIGAPAHYTLGKGHIKFFYDKAIWLHDRYELLIYEMMNRRMKPDPHIYSAVFRSISALPEALQNDWQPSDADLALNRQRIDERLTEMETKDEHRRAKQG